MLQRTTKDNLKGLSKTEKEALSISKNLINAIWKLVEFQEKVTSNPDLEYFDHMFEHEIPDLLEYDHVFNNLPDTQQLKILAYLTAIAIVEFDEEKCQ